MNDLDTIVEDYERFLTEASERWKKVTIHVDDVRAMAEWIEKREHLDMIADTLRKLCAIVDGHEKSK